METADASSSNPAADQVRAFLRESVSRAIVRCIGTVAIAVRLSRDETCRAKPKCRRPSALLSTEDISPIPVLPDVQTESQLRKEVERIFLVNSRHHSGSLEHSNA